VRAAAPAAWYAPLRMSKETSIARYLEAAPTDEETARRAVDPYREMDVTARLDALADLLRGMDALLDGRLPVRPSGEELWRRWGDPSRGRPR